MWNVKIITHMKEKKEAEKQRDSPSSGVSPTCWLYASSAYFGHKMTLLKVLKMRNLEKRELFK